MRRYVFAVCAVSIACGGSSQTAPPPRGASASRGPSPAVTAAREEEPYDDPGEASDPATLTPLVAKAGLLPRFPQASVDERACWQNLQLSGDAQKDFDALVGRCGAPTGSIEYAKPATGKLHHALDKRDTYRLSIRGGLCYRFFGVGDSTIEKLDVIIERAGGALVGDDRANGPVAIIESSSAWCLDADGDYQFRIEVGGEGKGKYVFGVWARLPSASSPETEVPRKPRTRTAR